MSEVPEMVPTAGRLSPDVVAKRVKDAIRQGDGDVPLAALDWREDTIDRETPDYKEGFREGWFAHLDATRREVRRLEHRRAGWVSHCGKSGLSTFNCDCLDGGMGFITKLWEAGK